MKNFWDSFLPPDIFPSWRISGTSFPELQMNEKRIALVNRCAAARCDFSTLHQGLAAQLLLP